MRIFLLAAFVVAPVSAVFSQARDPRLHVRFEEPELQVESLAFTGNGVLAAGTENGDIHLWDVDQRTFLKTIDYFQKRSPEPLSDTESKFKEHLGLDPRRKGVVDLAFSPIRPHQLAVLHAGAGEIRVWNILDDRLSFDRTFVGTRSIALGPRGVLLGIGRGGGKPEIGLTGLPVVNVNSGKVHRTFGETLPLDATHFELAFSPQGALGRILLASAGGDGVARVWNLSNEKSVFTIKAHQTGSQVNPGYIWDIDFGPRGARLATASWDETVGVWSVPEGRELARFGLSTNAYNVAFSPDGSILAATHSDTVALFSAKSWEPVREWNVKNDSIRDIAFSRDGQYLAVGGGVAGQNQRNDFSVTVWRNPFYGPKD